ncbi:MAG: EF-P lysine aminoacylase EpmA [Pseudomonadota bacterium]
MLARLRDYFRAHNVLEVSTPSLCQYPVTDVHVDSLSARAAQLQRDYYLRTSPEYSLKRLLAAGYPDIYEIGPVFRDGESGRRHQPEFTMLEWYRHAYAIDDIVSDTLSVLHTALHEAPRDLSPDRVATYDSLLFERLGVDSDASIDMLRERVGPDFPQALEHDRDAMLDWLFDQQVAAYFDDARFTAVTHYPASQAALACIDPVSQRALRFEVYRGPLELANGFVELRDADEQRARFNNDIEIRTQQGRVQYPIDDLFLAALDAGLPQCAGVAVGIDRLMMALIGTDDIAKVVSFTSH